jgi:hypothetical protein
MVFIESILQPLQDLTRAMKEGKTRKDAPKPEEWDEWFQVIIRHVVFVPVSF